MSDIYASQTEWLAQVTEDILDPTREIIDPHHHLWEHPGLAKYFLEELWADTSSGHNVTKTVFMECQWSYLTDGPDHLKPVGETVFVAAEADRSKAGGEGQPEIAGMVCGGDLRIDQGKLDELLDAHTEASGGRFRGIRHALARTPENTKLMFEGHAPEGLSENEAFRAGVRHLGKRGLTYDSWHFHPQNPQFTALARACPDTTMVLDHFGTPVGVGPFKGKRQEIFESWKQGMADMATCDNVVLKIGALAQPVNGTNWREGVTPPPTSDQVVEAQRAYYAHAIELFGPQRCMFESNFPVDRYGLSYQVYWNAMKKIAADYSEDEKTAMFSGTAARIYRV